MTVGQKIKSRRIELNMSQDELAKKCGYKSRSSINKIEMSRDLPLKKVKQMADALDLSVSYLMGWNEPELDSIGSSDTAIRMDTSILMTADEKELIETYRNLDEESKRQLVLMLAFLKDQNSKK